MTTTYFLNAIMGNVFHSKSDPAIPAAYYIGLSSTTPSMDGSNVTEPSGNGYQRVQVTNLSEPTSGEIYNTTDIEFPESTGDWGTMRSYVLYDSPTGGNLLMYEDFPNSKVIQAETQARFKAGSLRFTLSNPIEG